MTIQNATHQEMSLIYALYMEAFPKEERKPFELIEQKVREGKMEILSIKDKEAFVGLVITVLHEDMALIDYFAIEATYRGQGIGGHALESLKQRYKNQRMFLEIEVINEQAANNAERIRRKAFYLSHGLEEAKIYVSLFGVEMELLTSNCTVTYDAYHALYTEIVGEKLAKQVYELK